MEMNTSFWNTTFGLVQKTPEHQHGSDNYTVYLLVDQNLGTYYVYLLWLTQHINQKSLSPLNDNFRLESRLWSVLTTHQEPAAMSWDHWLHLYNHRDTLQMSVPILLHSTCNLPLVCYQRCSYQDERFGNSIMLVYQSRYQISYT